MGLLGLGPNMESASAKTCSGQSSPTKEPALVAPEYRNDLRVVSWARLEHNGILSSRLQYTARVETSSKMGPPEKPKRFQTKYITQNSHYYLLLTQLLAPQRQ